MENLKGFKRLINFASESSVVPNQKTNILEDTNNSNIKFDDFTI